ncbi:MAG: radical SAM protein [Candidatus Yanofskybacteria bacterium]|nr:radical SAM protein [Candidatus Yanofskybacteria bacterium]
MSDSTKNPYSKDELRFRCTTTDTPITESSIRELISMVRAKVNTPTSVYPKTVLEGIISFLQNHSLHEFAGRSDHFKKNSFATSELAHALSYPDSSTRIKYLAYRYKFCQYPAQKILDDFPIVLVVEPTSVCNLRCEMCWWSDKSFTSEKSHMGWMDFGLFKDVVDEASEAGLCSMVFAGRGEPTLHPDFSKMVAYATQKGIIDVKINTNATKLTDKTSRELLEAGPALIVFSIDAHTKEDYEAIRRGAKFEEVTRNLKRFTELKKSEFPNSPTLSRVSMVVFKKSQDIEQARAYWAGLADEFASERATERLGIYESPLRPTENSPCSFLWERLYVLCDGRINPCDEDYKSTLWLGKIDQGHTIKSIWLGEKLQKMRADHMAKLKNNYSPCNRCCGF